MYKLPKSFDGAFFIGRTLELQSFSFNAVLFAFDMNVSITVYSSLQHKFGQFDRSSTVQNVPLTESRLMQLVGHTLTSVEGDANGTLTVEFDNGHVVQVFDDSPDFESYIIFDGEAEIIV
jgi:hypothetical protein